MPLKPVYLTSDVHLGGVPVETEASFHRWLRHAAGEAEQIVINGDLFDFWFEYRNAIPRGHTRTLGLLADVVDAGVPITVFGGNHDWWGGTYLEDEVGVRFFKSQQRMELGGRQALVAHGDGVGEGDLGYRFLSKILRNPVSVGAFRWMHPDLAGWFATRVSRTKKRGDTHKGPIQARVRAVHNWSQEQLAADSGLNMVLTGHTHSPECIEVDTDRWIINSGDWIYRKTYVVLSHGAAPELLHWEAP